MDECKCKPLALEAAAAESEALKAEVEAARMSVWGVREEMDTMCRQLTGHGRAVQVDPLKPTLKVPGTKRLTLEFDEPVSSFAFRFNLRRYAMGWAAAAGFPRQGGNRPISVYRLGEMPIHSCGQTVSAPRGKAGDRLNARTELRAKRQRSAREAICRNRPIIENKHSTDVEPPHPPPPPRVCMNGVLLRTRTRPSLNILLSSARL